MVGMYFWHVFLLPILIPESLVSIPIVLLCGVEQNEQLVTCQSWQQIRDVRPKHQCVGNASSKFNFCSWVWKSNCSCTWRLFSWFSIQTKIYPFLVHCKNRWKLLLLSFRTCVDYGSKSGRVGCHSTFRIVIFFGLSNSHNSNHSHSFYSHSGIAPKNALYWFV